MQARPAKIEITVAQPRFLVRGHVVLDLEWRCFRRVQNEQPRGDHFHFACRDPGIRFLPANHAALDGHNELRAQVFGLGVSLRILLLVEDDLCDSGAVAQINENQLP